MLQEAPFLEFRGAVPHHCSCIGNFLPEDVLWSQDGTLPVHPVQVRRSGELRKVAEVSFKQQGI